MTDLSDHDPDRGDHDDRSTGRRHCGPKWSRWPI